MLGLWGYFLEPAGWVAGGSTSAVSLGEGTAGSMTSHRLTPLFVKDDPVGFGHWLLEHYMEHRLFQGAIQESTGQSLPSYPIDTFGDSKKWLEVHDKMHQALWTAVGGGVSSDLATVDWDNLSNVHSWMDLHQQIHADVRDTLGL